jgi:hypothetical protein
MWNSTSAVANSHSLQFLPPLSLLRPLTVSLYLPAVSCASSCSHALAKAGCAYAPPNSKLPAISGDNASVSIPIGGAASLAPHSLLTHTTISQYCAVVLYCTCARKSVPSHTGSPNHLPCAPLSPPPPRASVAQAPPPLPTPQLVQPLR